MTPRERLKQARVKMRIIAAREYRQFLAGELDHLPGCHDERTTLDAIAHAYTVGVRDGREGKTPPADGASTRHEG